MPCPGSIARVWPVLVVGLTALIHPVQAYDLHFRQNHSAFSGEELRRLLDGALPASYDQTFADRQWSTWLLLDVHPARGMAAITLGLCPRLSRTSAALPVATMSFLEPWPATRTEQQTLLTKLVRRVIEHRPSRQLPNPMSLLSTASFAALAFAGGMLSADLALPGSAAGQSTSHPCWLNQVRQSCTVTPVGSQGAFKVSFSAGDRPFFVFTPAGPATTDNRRMKDDQGRLWLYSGHHSFTLREQGGDGNVISVQAD